MAGIYAYTCNWPVQDQQPAAFSSFWAAPPPARAGWEATKSAGSRLGVSSDTTLPLQKKARRGVPGYPPLPLPLGGGRGCPRPKSADNFRFGASRRKFKCKIRLKFPSALRAESAGGRG